MDGFKALAAPGLYAGARVLDVGAGRRPVFPPDERPNAVTYVGLDVSASELDEAPPRSYDATMVADVAAPFSRPAPEFDLIVSWQVFEHLRSVRTALDNFYASLRPGGYAVISLSGRFSAFGVLNMLIPAELGVRVVSRVMRRDAGTVFRAYYDDCYRSALSRLVGRWTAASIIPAWAGAAYFRTVRPLQAAYVFYEEWAATSGRDDLATHYFIQLRK